MIRRFWFVAPVLLVAMVAVIGIGGSRSASAADPAVTMRAGGGETGYSVNAFLPGSITVAENTTVTWQFRWLEVHNVVFGEPAGPPTQSGLSWPNANPGYIFSEVVPGNPANPPTFSVVFPTAGQYSYFCVIHPFMTGTVNVVASGDVDTQQEIDARADSEYAPRIAAAKAVASSLAGQPVSVTPKSDGTNLFELVVGGVTQQNDDAMQFFPSNVAIKVGDTVRWKSTIPVPHTATFNAPQGPPQGDPLETPRTPEETFDGTGLRNSGTLWTETGSPNWYTSYDLKFTKAGTFTYVCILHAPQGMVGTVTVGDAAAPSPTPKPPTTGTGESDGGVGTMWFAALAGLLIMASGTALILSARRN